MKTSIKVTKEQTIITLTAGKNRTVMCVPNVEGADISYTTEVGNEEFTKELTNAYMYAELVLNYSRKECAEFIKAVSRKLFQENVA